VYAPGTAVNAAYRLRVDGRNKNVLYSSADAPAWQTDLRTYFTPGEYVSVQGQVTHESHHKLCSLPARVISKR
jgi:hypothetical protein